MLDLSPLFERGFSPDNWTLTRKQKQIVTYILDHPGEVCYISLRELSKRIGCTEVTLLRLFQRLGFGGYADFKREYRRCYEVYIYEAAEEDSEIQRIQESNALLLNHICRQERQHLHAYLDAFDLDPIVQAAQMICLSEFVLTVGRGISKSMADILSSRLGALGVRAVEADPEQSGLMQNRLNLIDDRSVVILFSFPPYFEEISDAAKFAASKGARIIVFTDSPAAPAAAFGDPVIYCPAARGSLYNSFAAVLEAVNLLAHCIAIEQGSRQGVQFEKLEELRREAEYNEYHRGYRSRRGEEDEEEDED